MVALLWGDEMSTVQLLYSDGTGCRVLSLPLKRDRRAPAAHCMGFLNDSLLVLTTEHGQVLLYNIVESEGESGGEASLVPANALSLPPPLGPHVGRVLGHGVVSKVALLRYVDTLTFQLFSMTMLSPRQALEQCVQGGRLAEAIDLARTVGLSEDNVYQLNFSLSSARNAAQALRVVRDGRYVVKSALEFELPGSTLSMLEEVCREALCRVLVELEPLWEEIQEIDEGEELESLLDAQDESTLIALNELHLLCRKMKKIRLLRMVAVRRKSKQTRNVGQKEEAGRDVGIFGLSTSEEVKQYVERHENSLVSMWESESSMGGDALLSESLEDFSRVLGFPLSSLHDLSLHHIFVFLARQQCYAELCYAFLSFEEELLSLSGNQLQALGMQTLVDTMLVPYSPELSLVLLQPILSISNRQIDKGLKGLLDNEQLYNKQCKLIASENMVERWENSDITYLSALILLSDNDLVTEMHLPLENDDGSESIAIVGSIVTKAFQYERFGLSFHCMSLLRYLVSLDESLVPSDSPVHHLYRQTERFCQLLLDELIRDEIGLGDFLTMSAERRLSAIVEGLYDTSGCHELNKEQFTTILNVMRDDFLSSPDHVEAYDFLLLILSDSAHFLPALSEDAVVDKSFLTCFSQCMIKQGGMCKAAGDLQHLLYAVWAVEHYLENEVDGERDEAVWLVELLLLSVLRHDDLEPCVRFVLPLIDPLLERIPICHNREKNYVEKLKELHGVLLGAKLLSLYLSPPPLSIIYPSLYLSLAPPPLTFIAKYQHVALKGRRYMRELMRGESKSGMGAFLLNLVLDEDEFHKLFAISPTEALEEWEDDSDLAAVERLLGSMSASNLHLTKIIAALGNKAPALQKLSRHLLLWRESWPGCTDPAESVVLPSLLAAALSYNATVESLTTLLMAMLYGETEEGTGAGDDNVDNGGRDSDIYASVELVHNARDLGLDVFILTRSCLLRMKDKLYTRGDSNGPVDTQELALWLSLVELLLGYFEGREDSCQIYVQILRVEKCYLELHLFLRRQNVTAFVLTQLRTFRSCYDITSYLMRTTMLAPPNLYSLLTNSTTGTSIHKQILKYVSLTFEMQLLQSSSADVTSAIVHVLCILIAGAMQCEDSKVVFLLACLLLNYDVEHEEKAEALITALAFLSAQADFVINSNVLFMLSKHVDKSILSASTLEALDSVKDALNKKGSYVLFSLYAQTCPVDILGKILHKISEKTIVTEQVVDSMEVLLSGLNRGGVHDLELWSKDLYAALIASSKPCKLRTVREYLLTRLSQNAYHKSLPPPTPALPFTEQDLQTCLSRLVQSGYSAIGARKALSQALNSPLAHLMRPHQLYESALREAVELCRKPNFDLPTICSLASSSRVLQPQGGAESVQEYCALSVALRIIQQIEGEEYNKSHSIERKGGDTVVGGAASRVMTTRESKPADALHKERKEKTSKKAESGKKKMHAVKLMVDEEDFFGDFTQEPEDRSCPTSPVPSCSTTGGILHTTADAKLPEAMLPKEQATARPPSLEGTHVVISGDHELGLLVSAASPDEATSNLGAEQVRSNNYRKEGDSKATDASAGQLRSVQGLPVHVVVATGLVADEDQPHHLELNTPQVDDDAIIQFAKYETPGPSTVEQDLGVGYDAQDVQDVVGAQDAGATDIYTILSPDTQQAREHLGVLEEVKEVCGTLEEALARTAVDEVTAQELVKENHIIEVTGQQGEEGRQQGVGQLEEEPDSQDTWSADLDFDADSSITVPECEGQDAAAGISARDDYKSQQVEEPSNEHPDSGAVAENQQDPGSAEGELETTDAWFDGVGLDLGVDSSAMDGDYVSAGAAAAQQIAHGSHEDHNVKALVRDEEEATTEGPEQFADQAMETATAALSSDLWDDDIPDDLLEAEGAKKGDEVAATGQGLLGPGAWESKAGSALSEPAGAESNRDEERSQDGGQPGDRWSDDLSLSGIQESAELASPEEDTLLLQYVQALTSICQALHAHSYGAQDKLPIDATDLAHQLHSAMPTFCSSSPSPSSSEQSALEEAAVHSLCALCARCASCP
ncbi:hypothetical protein EON64_02465, partial [archaeon]